MSAPPALLVHGGAGTVAPERHARVRAGVRAAAEVGHAVLAAGGSALDAVVAAVRVLEDDPEYNAGTGAALTRDGLVQTDAAVMDGATQRVGAVGAVPDLGCAVQLARAVLDAGEHAMLVGPMAWHFAAEHGIRPVLDGSLVTDRARARLQAVLARPGAQDGGTVGAVARDARGHLAAATSTGGIAGKRSGRVGDSPIAGAGTWADGAAAVSATGDGEAILRVALAHAIAVRVSLGATPAAAADASLADLARVTGGTAGVIVLTTTDRAIVHLSAHLPCAWISGADRGDQIA